MLGNPAKVTLKQRDVCSGLTNRLSSTPSHRIIQTCSEIPSAKNSPRRADFFSNGKSTSFVSSIVVVGSTLERSPGSTWVAVRVRCCGWARCISSRRLAVTCRPACFNPVPICRCGDSHRRRKSHSTIKQVDFVTAVCVYHHVPEDLRQSFTAEIRRVLRPGGIFCIIEHNPLNPATRLIVSRTPIDTDAHLLRARATARLMAGAGTKVLETRYFLLFPQQIHAYLHALEDRLSTIPLGGQYAVFASP